MPFAQGHCRLHRHDSIETEADFSRAIVAAVEGAKSEEEKKAAHMFKVTSHPSVKDEIVGKGWDYSESRVVVDGKIITSRG